jgi:two-component system nitrate/nitrite response regulator NarL
MTVNPATLVLADDHPLVLAGLRKLIESYNRFAVVAECADGTVALNAIREHRPAIAIVDLNMPRFGGLDVLGAVLAEKLPTRILLMAATIRDDEIYTAVESGVYGIVLKDWAPAVLMNCLDTTLAGQRWLPPDQLIDAAVEREKERQEFAQTMSARLTVRERQIALLAADGLSSKEVARQLELSEGTVKLHLHNVFRKLGVSKRIELASVVHRIRDKLVPAQNN